MKNRLIYLTLRLGIISAYLAYILFNFVDFNGFAWAQQAGQQNPLMLTDEHIGPASSRPYGFMQFNGETYFGVAGRKGGLWKTDGTAEGTSLVKDVRLYQPSGTDMSPTAASEDFLFFVVDQGPVADLSRHAYELWRSDGTPGGTIRLHQFQYAPFTYYPQRYYSDQPWSLDVLDDVLYFNDFDSEYGNELWRSDGSVDGTRLFLDIDPGNTSSNPQDFVVWNEQLFFVASDSGNGQRIWQTDGTVDGTQAAVDVNSSDNYSRQLSSLMVANNALYFESFYSTVGGELWKSDGTTAGTNRVATSYPGPIGNLDTVDDELFYSLPSGYFNHTTLWHTDGTQERTNRVWHSSLFEYISGRTSAENRLYFTVADRNSSFNDLNGIWYSDGSTSAIQAYDQLPHTDHIAAVGDDLYFVLNNLNGKELWRSDGTIAGTALVTDIVPTALDNAFNVPYPSPIYSTGEGVLFGVDDGQVGKELWYSNGTGDGTALVKDIDTNSLGMELLAAESVGDTLYFLSHDSVSHYLSPNSLWKSDGSVNGTSLVTTLPSTHSQYVDTATAGGILYFIHDQGFWRTDGTTDGTFRLMSSAVQNMTPLNGQLYFRIWSRLWHSDGTVDGTAQVEEDRVTVDGDIYRFGNRLFFLGSQIGQGYGLFESDGTDQGATLIKPLASPTYSDRYGLFFHHDDTLYFSAHGSGYTDPELWRSDKTEEGTQLIKILDPGSAEGAYPHPFAAVVPTSQTSRVANNQSYILFSAYHAEYGRELWRTDGTDAGTALVQDIRPGQESSSPMPIVNMSGFSLFQANDGQHGLELWRSDGTDNGTVLVADIRPGAYGAQIDEALRIGDYTYFCANDGIHGAELWSTDGTTAGTMMLFDLYPGAPSSDPSNLTYRDGVLYFSADDGINGVQLRSISVQAPLALDVVEEPEENPTQFRYIPFFSHTVESAE
ncbi:MAG: ELWxxDGT repeat protein [Chloroflexota bacterium]